jgi:nucleoside-diphosphate-sugar epimerase
MQPGLVVVTGADGFIGRALCAHFRASGRPHRALVRHASRAVSANEYVVADLATAAEVELDAAMAGAAAIVHLAGRAHVLEESEPDPVASYRHANIIATARVAQAAVRAGAGRLVYASTIKVHGESSAPGSPLRPESPCVPADDYARSKVAAEREVNAICAGTRVAPLILRLPLVYGPGVKGNFLTLMDEVARGRTLPLGAIRNRRSILYVGNLVDAIVAALDAVPPPTGTYFVADAKSVAVPDLARAIGVALGEPVRLPRVPVLALELGARLLGKRAMIERLTRTLEVDTTSFSAATGWHPRHALAEGLAETAKWWRLRHAI